jgi:CcmD family protein
VRAVLGITAVPGVTPALPLHEAGKYVAAAYIVLFAVVLVYVAIMALRLSRIERELGELLELGDGPRNGAAAPRDGATPPGNPDVGRPPSDLSDGEDPLPEPGVDRPRSSPVGAPSE